MILVDTSVWIDHFRRRNTRLIELLDEGVVLCHPFVVGELACGNLQNREEILGLLAALPEARAAEHKEVLHVVRRYHLHAHRLGWIDMHLLASALLNRSRLWSLDKPLSRVARTLKIDA